MKTKSTAALILLLAFLICGCTSPSSSDGTSPPPAQTAAKPKPAEVDSITAATQSGQEWSGNDLEIKFCWCPAGKFIMGSPKDEVGREGDERQHEVTLTQGFWLGKYEVTQAQYERVMGENPSNFKGDSLPVERVSWEQATEFCKKLTGMETEAGRLPPGWEYGLPTEAQWEYACRAGTTTAYSLGDDASKLVDYAWYYENSEGKTHPVGEKLENAWGLCDMHGNVFEWCADSWGKYATEPVTDPSGPPTGSLRVLRGGSWAFGALNCRAAYRYRFEPQLRYEDLGFRVAAVPSSQGPEAQEPESGAERDSR